MFLPYSMLQDLCREASTPPFSLAAGIGTCVEKLLLLPYPLLQKLEDV